MDRGKLPHQLGLVSGNSSFRSMPCSMESLEKWSLTSFLLSLGREWVHWRTKGLSFQLGLAGSSSSMKWPWIRWTVCVRSSLAIRLGQYTFASRTKTFCSLGVKCTKHSTRKPAFEKYSVTSSLFRPAGAFLMNKHRVLRQPVLLLSIHT